MNNNLMLFQELGLEEEVTEQYSIITLTNEQSALIKQFCLEISFENNIYSQVRKIFQREYELEDKVKIVLLQFISLKKDLLYLLINDDSKNDFFYLDIIIYSFEALIYKNDFHITKEEVNQLCELMYSIPFNTSELYKTLVKVLKSTPNLSEEIIANYKLKPNKHLIPLVVCLLQTDQDIKKFITSLSNNSYTNKLFIVRACKELKKTERTFVINLIKNKLSKISAPEYDKYELLNPYLALLFSLYIDSEEKMIYDEIKRVIKKFTDWDSEGLLTVIYASSPKVSATFASLLFMIVNKLPNNKQSHIDHYIDSLFSQLSPSELNKYYLSLFSLLHDEAGNKILNKLQEDIDVYFEGLLKSVLEADEDSQASLNLLMKLLNNNSIDMKMIDEQYYLYLLRCFHCFMYEADFVCSVAIEFYLNSITKEMQDKIYEYVVESISENYFMVLKKIITEKDHIELHSLVTYLNEKDDLMNLALNNPDFRPSVKRMEQYYEKRADQNRKIQEEAKERSVFRNLFQSQTILYGHKVRSYYQEDTGDLHEQENIMNKMEYSIPIPTRFIFDPLFHQKELYSISKGFLND